MKKLAVFINGLSAPIKDDYFLSVWLKKHDYEVLRIEPILQQSISKVIRVPDLIIGWSMGGLIAPELALKYPQARLMLVATAIKVMPSEKMAKALFEVVGKEWGLKLLGKGLELPNEILVTGYENFVKIPSPEVKEKYRKQFETNVNLFRRLPYSEVARLAKFLRVVDNTEILEKLKNKTLVLSGERDNIMPIVDGQKIAELVRDGKFVKTNGGHFNVIGQSELPIIEEFLK
jgi:pimeloyl-ACP methyl ester carboxylesterase